MPGLRLRLPPRLDAVTVAVTATAASAMGLSPAAATARRRLTNLLRYGRGLYSTRTPA